MMLEEEKRIEEALECLSPEHRKVLVMKDIEGCNYEEIAEILEVPIGTVRSRLHRARQELAEVFKRSGRDDDGHGWVHLIS